MHGRILSIKWKGMYNIIKRSLNERQKQAAVENEEQTEGREGRKGAQWVGWPTVLTGKKGISPFSLLIKSYRTERKMTNKKPLIAPNVTVWTPFWSLFNNSPLPSPFVSLRFHHFVCRDIKTFSVKQYNSQLAEAKEVEEEWSEGGVEGKRCGCCQSFYLYEKAAAAKKKKKCHRQTR